MSYAESSIRATPRDAPRRSTPRVHLHDPALSDAELVARALEGDRWARGAIYQRYAAELSNLAARLLVDRDQALDVLQDTFVGAFETLHKLRNPARLRPWLRAIAVRHVQRRFRRRRLLRTLGIVREPADGSLAELARADADQETVAQLRRAEKILGRLPPRTRLVFCLRHVEGETLPAIAEALDTSLATVKRDLRVAQERLERQMGGRS